MYGRTIQWRCASTLNDWEVEIIIWTWGREIGWACLPTLHPVRSHPLFLFNNYSFCCKRKARLGNFEVPFLAPTKLPLLSPNSRLCSVLACWRHTIPAQNHGPSFFLGTRSRHKNRYKGTDKWLSKWGLQLSLLRFMRFFCWYIKKKTITKHEFALASKYYH